MTTFPSRRVCCFLTAVVLLSATSSMALSDETTAKKSYTFGVVPQQSASKLARLWGPVLQEISKQTGLVLRFQTAKDIPAFERVLAEGGYDFAYMNPYHFTVFNRSPGYRAIGKERGKKIQGIVVVQKDNPIQSIEELDGTIMAFPAPAAFAASVLPRAQFRASNIAITPKYVSSHDSVYRVVAKGLNTAGGGILRTFENTEPTIRKDLRILWRTEKYTPHAIAAHPDIDDGARTKISQALIGLSSSETGRKRLKSLNFKEIEAASDQDWDDIRSLGIDLLTDLLKGK